MIGTQLPRVTQHYIQRTKTLKRLVHFEIAYQMTWGRTACGIDLIESRMTYDETRAAVNCPGCKMVLANNMAEVKRNRAQHAAGIKRVIP